MICTKENPLNKLKDIVFYGKRCLFFVIKEKPHAKRVEGRKLKQRPPDIIEEGPPAKAQSGGRVKMSNDESSLSHTRWDCKYHIVFAPKFRRKEIYGQLKAEIGAI